jgi:hypothetical protein
MRSRRTNARSLKYAMNSTSAFVFLLFALTGCATQTALVIDHDHPASPAAPEASDPAPRRSLATDEITRHTRQLIAERANAVDAPAQDANPGQAIPTAPATGPASTKKPAGHDHH